MANPLENARQDAETVLKERKDSMRDKFNAKVHDPAIHVGDTVYLYRPVLEEDQSRKLASPWSGPHYVVHKFSSIHVQLRRHSDNSLLPGRIHVNRLKKASDRTLPHWQPDHADYEKTDPVGMQPPATSTQEKSPQHGEPDTSQAQSPDFYEVERFVAKRCVGPVQDPDSWQYRVKWLSFPAKYNSWVTYANLNPTLQSLADKIHSTLPTYGKKTGRKGKRKK